MARSCLNRCGLPMRGSQRGLSDLRKPKLLFSFCLTSTCFCRVLSIARARGSIGASTPTFFLRSLLSLLRTWLFSVNRLHAVFPCLSESEMCSLNPRCCMSMSAHESLYSYVGTLFATLLAWNDSFGFRRSLSPLCEPRISRPQRFKQLRAMISTHLYVEYVFVAENQNSNNEYRKI